MGVRLAQDEDEDEDGVPAWPDDEAALLMGEGGELEPPRWMGARMNGAAGLLRQGGQAHAAVEVSARLSLPPVLTAGMLRVQAAQSAHHADLTLGQMRPWK